jgi:hypothetical protein
VSSSLVNFWVQRGVLIHDQRRTASKVWVRLNEDDFARLTGGAPEAANLPSMKALMAQAQLSQSELWDQVRRGQYRAYRIQQGRTWQWRLKAVSANSSASSKATTVGRNGKGTAPYE